MTDTMKQKHLNIHLLVTCFQVAFYAEVQVPFFALENHAKVFVAVIPVRVGARRRKRKKNMKIFSLLLENFHDSQNLP